MASPAIRRATLSCLPSFVVTLYNSLNPCPLTLMMSASIVLNTSRSIFHPMNVCGMFRTSQTRRCLRLGVGRHFSGRVLKRRRGHTLSPPPSHVLVASDERETLGEGEKPCRVWGETVESVATSFLGWTPIAVRPVAVGVYGWWSSKQGSAARIDSLWYKTHVVARVIARGCLVRRDAYT